MRTAAIGAALLLAAGLSVAAVPALRPTLIDGTATAMEIPGIPAVGNCVTEPVSESDVEWMMRHPTVDTVVYPALAIAPCDGPRYGEISAVIPAPAAVKITGDNVNRSVTDPNGETCFRSGYSYLGFPDGLPDLQWAPVLAVRTVTVQPLPRQRDDGQGWLACVVYVQSSSDLDPGTAFDPYSGTLRDATITGNQSGQLGYCGDTTPVNSGGDGVCEQPHQVQQLAITSSANPVSSTKLTQTCTETANALVGRDITAGGDLAVVVTATDNLDGTPVAVDGDLPAGLSLQCNISAPPGRPLAGSLVGLGDRPIPWA